MLLALPALAVINATLVAVCATFWLGVLSAATLGYAWKAQSVPALSSSVSTAARAAGVLSVPLRAWGALPPLASVGNLGGDLAALSDLGQKTAEVLPRALGEDRPIRYLVSSLNDAELFASGGAPLDLLVLEFDRGRPSIEASGSVAGEFNPNNVAYPWARSGGLPWYKPGALYPFANSNFHPDFGFSGPNMLSAWAGLGQPPAEGVITLDMVAIAAALRASGPITSGEYGIVTGDNVISKVLVDAYRRWPEEQSGAREFRRRQNELLRANLIQHLRDPVRAWRALRAVAETIPGRHVQAHMADARLQDVVEAAGAQATLATAPGDLLGVFVQSGVSKLAIFQECTISRAVKIAADGSAKVEQVATFANNVPDELEGDPQSHRGYLALVFRQRVAFRIPDEAQNARVAVTGARPLVGPLRTGPYPDEVGGRVLWQGQDIPPGLRGRTIVNYELPPGTFTSATGLNYYLTANPQASVQPVALRLTVEFPSDTRIFEQDDWSVTGSKAAWTGSLDRSLSLSVVGAGHSAGVR